MARWRPPAEKSSPYITAEGYRALEVESKQLWQKRIEVTRAVAAAAAEGDRSENAEYIYRKKQLRELDRRIRYLLRRMPILNIVSEVSDPERVYFGATVTLENDSGDEFLYCIVGADEFDTEKHYISVDAPLPRALLGKRVDDEIVIKTAQGEQSFIILKIDYSRLLD